MKPAAKLALVGAGYVAAFALACTAVVARMAATPSTVAQASGGMQTFGDLVLFVAVFGIASLLPTAAMLYLLRQAPRFWAVLAGVAQALALTGLAALALYVMGRDATPPSALATWAAFSVLRILASPLLFTGFVLGTALAGLAQPRKQLLLASLAELVVSGYVFFTWLLPLVLGRH